MLKKIIQTIFSKGIIAILNFLIVMITAKYTGAVGRGEISLMYLNITIVLMFNDIIGGSALVYLIPKIGVKKIVFPAFINALFCGLVLPLLFNLYHDYNSINLAWFIALSVTLNLSSVCNVLLNGIQKISTNNLINVFQTFVIFGVLCFLIFFSSQNTASTYYKSLITGFSINLILSLGVLLKSILPIEKIELLKTLKQIVSYGFIVQMGNLIQLLNYRITYYLIDYYFPASGKSQLGVFSTGTSISESAWVIMNGISMVQYAAISNRNDDSQNINYSIKLSKISGLLTLLVMIVMILFPQPLFVYFFGTDFINLKEVIFILSPGIIAMGFTGIYSHYFAGSGLMKISTFASLGALGVSILFGNLFVPEFGYRGAAFGTCLSYLTSSVILTIAFKQKAKCSLKEQFFSLKHVFKIT